MKILGILASPAWTHIPPMAVRRPTHWTIPEPRPAGKPRTLPRRSSLLPRRVKHAFIPMTATKCLSFHEDMGPRNRLRLIMAQRGCEKVTHRESMGPRQPTDIRLRMRTTQAGKQPDILSVG